MIIIIIIIIIITMIIENYHVCVCVSEVFGEGEEGVEGCLGGEVPGHSRNSSNTSHGSHASGYASINSQSEVSGHIR